MTSLPLDQFRPISALPTVFVSLALYQSCRARKSRTRECKQWDTRVVWRATMAACREAPKWCCLIGVGVRIRVRGGNGNQSNQPNTPIECREEERERERKKWPPTRAAPTREGGKSSSMLTFCAHANFSSTQCRIDRKQVVHEHCASLDALARIYCCPIVVGHSGAGLC